jgi:hypothetical protein
MWQFLFFGHFVIKTSTRLALLVIPNGVMNVVIAVSTALGDSPK